MKKTSDAVAFMPKRREELSRVYSGLNFQQIEERIRNMLKDDPLWKKSTQSRTSMSTGKEPGELL